MRKKAVYTHMEDGRGRTHIRTSEKYNKPERTKVRKNDGKPSGIRDDAVTPEVRRYGRKGKQRSSRKEHRVDALALRADERRDKLRKAAGRSTYPVIRRCLNGETRMRTPHASARQSITCGGEPGELKHLSSRRKRKKKSVSFSKENRFPE